MVSYKLKMIDIYTKLNSAYDKYIAIVKASLQNKIINKQLNQEKFNS